MKQQMKESNRLTKRNEKIHLSRWIQSPYRNFLQGAGRLLLSCGIVFLLLLIMFLLAKGPAYISFREDKIKQSVLSGLYSQCIHLQADQVAVDISRSSYQATQITGTTIELSSDSLNSWLSVYLEQAGVANIRNTRLLIEGDQPYEVGLTYQTAGATVRYMMERSDDIYIDSTMLNCSFRQLQIYPRVTTGEAYESFVTIHEDITVRIPDDPYIRCYIVYDSEKGTGTRIPIDMTDLPDCQNVSEHQMWSFSLHDAALQIQSADKTPLQLESSGLYALRLSCIGAARIRGYLTGELLFQNTNTPKNYTLAGQFVDIGSRSDSLNVILSRDTTGEPQCEDELFISGEATQMDISGVNPFPDMRMWFRENVYMTPVSLLSVMISMYGLPREKGSRKVRPRKVNKQPLDQQRSVISDQ